MTGRCGILLESPISVVWRRRKQRDVIFCYAISYKYNVTFVFNIQVIKSLTEQNNEEPGAKYSIVAMETTEKLQRICANVVGYCKTVMNSTGKCIRVLDLTTKPTREKLVACLLNVICFHACIQVYFAFISSCLIPSAHCETARKVFFPRSEHMIPVG